MPKLLICFSFRIYTLGNWNAKADREHEGTLNTYWEEWCTREECLVESLTVFSLQQGYVETVGINIASLNNLHISIYCSDELPIEGEIHIPLYRYCYTAMFA